MQTKQRFRSLAAADLVLVALVFCFTPAATAVGIPWVGYDWDSWHAFVLPHMFLAVSLTVIALWYLVRSSRTHLLIILGWAQPLLAGTYLWAMYQWPGGDDGGGMSWLLIVGPVTAVTLVVTAIAAAGRSNQEPRAAAVARTVYCISAATGFGIRALLPWIDIALAR